jgi:hypothetical protein
LSYADYQGYGNINGEPTLDMIFLFLSKLDFQGSKPWLTGHRKNLPNEQKHGHWKGGLIALWTY